MPLKLKTVLDFSSRFSFLCYSVKRDKYAKITPGCPVRRSRSSECVKTAAVENVNSTFQQKQGSESTSRIVLVCCEDKRTSVTSERQNQQADKTAGLNNMTTAWFMLAVTGKNRGDVTVYSLICSNSPTLQICGFNMITTILFVQRTFHKPFPPGCFLFIENNVGQWMKDQRAI